jgi:hypothetical protein
MVWLALGKAQLRSVAYFEIKCVLAVVWHTLVWFDFVALFGLRQMPGEPAMPSRVFLFNLC